MPLIATPQTDTNMVSNEPSAQIFSTGGPVTSLECQGEQGLIVGEETGLQFPDGGTLRFGMLPLMISAFEDRGALREADENQWSKSADDKTSLPKLEWPSQQDPILSSTVRKLLNVLWAIVVSRALQRRFPVRRTTVAVFEDPTERERTAVLRLFCNTTPLQALAFWDSLETDLQNWLEMLSDHERTVFISRVSLSVHWQ